MSSSSGSLKSQPTSKGQPPGLATSTSNLLLEKLNGRRSTPDSDAMASSEDEEHQNQETSMPTAATHKPVRRASWLNDTTQPLGQPRKNSFASSTMSPTASHPTTPSTETGLWGTHAPAAASIAAGRGGGTAFPWGSQGIWNPKEPPARLTEVFASSPPASSSSFANSGILGSDATPTGEGSLPFQIPLHPTPKTYRSQSYSVGQMEADLQNLGSAQSNAPGFGRGRGLNQSGLQHRPSRPSMLGDLGDNSGLGKLKEVEDDEAEGQQSLESSTHSLLQMGDPAKVVEELVRENAMLRQQQQNMRSMRPRSATSNTLGYGPGYGLEGGLTEDPSDYAIDEMDEIGELQDISNKGLLGRRMSEYEFRSSQAGRGAFGSLENRKLESLKKSQWQSSLGFGANEFITPSRRHSFADVPTRHGSIGSIGDPSNGLSDLPTAQEVQRFSAEPDYLNDHAASYFGGPSVQSRNVDAYGMTSPSFNPYAMQNSYGGMSQGSSHRNMYNVSQPRHNQLLYIVLFKCSRADVFYVQEGTGLSVKPGDLVIVEADRGTDLGTVAHDNVDWATAKELKEQYAEEHYKWLMMYSQGAVGTQDGTGAGLMAASNGLQGSAVGGMGPPTQHGMQEPSSGELKPKIIKRLAQNHEIQALRDKEGNEAKAKRVCMQKVKEHGLHMEILDAEFQMDWKKLTFYYFADAYINFNSLVTDLFKVYKTRIWMSAINPASFASPSLGLQAPSGVGPGAVGVNRHQSDRRQQQQEQSYNPRAGGGGGGYDRGAVSPMSFQHQHQQQQQPLYGYASSFSPSSSFTPSSFNTQGRNGYNNMPQIDPFAAFAPDYGLPMSSSYMTAPTHPQEDTYGRQGAASPNQQWIGAFQSLSLGSR